MVLGLAQAGVQVIATAALEQAQVEAIAEEAENLCGEPCVLPLLADVTRDEDCVRTVAMALNHFGRLDILVNNAGRGMKYVSEHFLTEPTRFWDIAPETWRMVIDTNVNGPFLMAREAAPVMIKAGWGRIINVSMNHETMHRHGSRPTVPPRPHSSRKRSSGQDLAGTGVTVNALLPGGATLTGMIPDSVPDQIRMTLLDPSVMVPPLLWLASPDSDGITGRRIVATNWRTDQQGREAAEAAVDPAGWP